TYRYAECPHRHVVSPALKFARVITRLSGLQGDDKLDIVPVAAGRRNSASTAWLCPENFGIQFHLLRRACRLLLVSPSGRWALRRPITPHSANRLTSTGPRLLGCAIASI